MDDRFRRGFRRLPILTGLSAAVLYAAISPSIGAILFGWAVAALTALLGWVIAGFRED